ncbi:Serine/threonine-protein phosphatase 4 catalytic subunit 2 [Tritrichomonas foetus]|uniref:Serine/threonine-protein phosphatase n=1 Tax=Tritrichomonas foetus TaxID=1144522 RepID=A0A1J4J129_9EUKA|nr:Serine/threonine-protein phosphatase 4 catalytic subunit 2 [Tritrichomonas foetus]|eukprot:OHS93122.1 Serine/threonine-protein phosphatase 4 catalytic subunit 2 [Tritrichomonas foetus]
MPAIQSDAKLLASRMVPLRLPRFTPEQVSGICRQVQKIFSSEPTILEVYSPVTVVGDIHGHILDLFRILNKCGMPPFRKYLFLGDIVDRGEFSIETLIVIFLLKIVYTDHIYIIRGNHEFDYLCQQCGFFTEVVKYYEEPTVYNSCINVFGHIPLAAKINNSFLCVHGGIGPSFTSLDKFYSIKKPFDDFGDDDFIDSVLWSDPSTDVEQYAPSSRGSGYFFGAEATKEFCEKNHIKMIIRGHECVNDGFEYHFDQKLITVFSASNYCGLVGNKAAVLEIISTDKLVTHDFPPLPYLNRYEALFGAHLPEEPRSPVSPNSAPRFSNSVRAPLVHSMVPAIEIGGTDSLNAFPKLPTLRTFENLPPLKNFSPRRPSLAAPTVHSPRKRRKSSVY